MHAVSSLCALSGWHPLVTWLVVQTQAFKLYEAEKIFELQDKLFRNVVTDNLPVCTVIQIVDSMMDSHDIVFSSDGVTKAQNEGGIANLTGQVSGSSHSHDTVNDDIIRNEHSASQTQNDTVSSQASIPSHQLMHTSMQPPRSGHQVALAQASHTMPLPPNVGEDPEPLILQTEWTHGYNIESQLHIIHALDHSSSREEFVMDLASYSGIAIEMEFLYYMCSLAHT
ncbi:hypothetical protein WOLCODRAFT_19126 [Wolfiporia cocos MD-104 SS10]|uniref:Uncharacterized protein n=1 Tax=Wolfiporia cocos (strain MD-104) TaxID=742152 RepID=A0A2H3K8G1_WOLCO|nr:hypothetical protein WOLCODRAFT_19126 [Wolfiporia cocos MD-104 SS10]